jgi:hypothetical protein
MKAALIAVMVMAMCGLAWAEKPVVVIVGDDAAVVSAVEKAMKGKVEQVAESEMDRATAVVEVTITGKKKAKKVTAVVTVTQVADGAEIGRMEVKEKRAKLAKTVGKGVWKKVGRAVMGARGRVRADEPVAQLEPVEPKPDPVDRAAPQQVTAERPPTPTSTSTPTSTTVEIRPGQARWAVSVDERPFYRRLRWNDDLNQVLRRYDLAANAVGVGVGVRPWRNGFVVGVSGEMVVGVSGSKTSDGMSYATSSSEVSGGVGYGFRIGQTGVGVSAAYGEHRFSIDDEAMLEELVPDVTYRWVRGGLEGSRPMGKRWSLVARGGWRYLLGTGEMNGDAWFPRATGQGVDGGLGVNVRLTKWLGAYARADVRHYFFAMNPEPGDEVIAGGAVDSYLGGAVGIAVSIK